METIKISEVAKTFAMNNEHYKANYVDINSYHYFMQSSSPVKMWWAKSFVGKYPVGKSPCGKGPHTSLSVSIFYYISG